MVSGDADAALQSVSIAPANPALVVRGAIATQPFTAIGRYADGTTRPILLGAWSLSRARAGSISAETGTFTATGQVGDVTEVRYELPRPGRRAAARDHQPHRPLRARVLRDARHRGRPLALRDAHHRRRSRGTGALPPCQRPRPAERCPPGRAVGAGRRRGRLPRLAEQAPRRRHQLRQPRGAGFRYDWAVDAAGWRALVESDLDDPITLRVDRATAGAAIAGPARTLRVALGSLAGAVYYWDLRAGRILRIREEPTGPVREDFLPNPPQRATGGRSRCVACHTISRDGLQMAAELWEGGSPSNVFDLGRDLTADPAPTRFPVTDTAASPSWVYGSFNANGTRLIANRYGGLFLVNPATGATVPPVAGTLPQGASVQPSWSPDGNTIAYISEFMGEGPTAFSSSNLSTIPVTAADSFGPPTQRVMGASLMAQREGGRALAYPTWTPDSRWLAFQHGPYSESDRPGASAGAPRTRFPAALYLIAPTGGTPTRLTRASADEAEDDAYFPNFSPFVQGGHYWLVYFSRRAYGNAQAGTRGTNRRQLWVTAISTTVTAGADPSDVPYWLPGQDVGSDNVSGFWAPQPCRSRGAGCTVSSECCAGNCGPDGTGALVCNPPPPEAPCRTEGERCGAGSDCCAGFRCAANVCLRSDR